MSGKMGLINAVSLAKRARMKGVPQEGAGMDKEGLLKSLFKKKMSMGGMVKEAQDDNLPGGEDDDFDLMDNYAADEEALMADEIVEEGMDGPALTVSTNDLDERKKLIGSLMNRRALRR